LFYVLFAALLICYLICIVDCCFPQGDEPSSGIAQKNLQHFDHTFKGELHTTSGASIVKIFGSCKGAHRPVVVVCKGSSMTLIEEIGITSKTQADLPFELVRFMDDKNYAFFSD
jgi:hypothetical protein